MSEPVVRRHRARQMALDILYEHEITHRPIPEIEAVYKEADARRVISAFTRELVDGVLARQAELDEVLGGYARDWTVERMPAVDRSIMRIAAFEMIFAREVPESVAIDEAVELAKLYGGADSPGFVNGVLGKVAEELPSLRAIMGPKEGEK